MPPLESTPSAELQKPGLALEQAAQAVLGDAWGCVPVSPVNVAPLAVPSHGAALSLSIKGQPHALQLLAEVGVVAALLPRMLGRNAAAEEVDSMGDEFVDELLNQVGGRLAGLLGEQGVAVELGTPVGLAAGPSAVGLAAAPSAVALSAAPSAMALAAVPTPLAVTSWNCVGHGLVLSLLRTPLSPS